MNHTVTSPVQTSPSLSGLNHNETLITARPARRGIVLSNHNETLITARPGCLSGLQTNHNETLITARPGCLSGLQTNHNETLITARSAPFIVADRNGTLFADSPWAWPDPSLRHPAAGPAW
jgi:hypothetical protein